MTPNHKKAQCGKLLHTTLRVGRHDLRLAACTIATISNRIQRAYSYLSEIRALLTDMPFGKKGLQIGLMLRNAMFLNGVLFNSEVVKGI